MKSLKMISAVLTILLMSIGAYSTQPLDNEDYFNRVMLFQWTEDVNQETKSEVLNLFSGLPEQVDGFLGIDIVDLSMSSEEFETLLILKFSSPDAAKRYEEHPDHKKIQEIAPPLVSKFEMFEYSSSE